MNVRLFVLTLTLILGGWTIRAVAVAEPPVSHPLESLPLTLGAWTGEAEAPLDADALAVLRVDDYITRIYSKGPEAVELYVAYYATQQQGGTMHSPLNCLPGTGWESVSKRLEQVALSDGSTIDLNHYVVQKGLDNRLVLYWYQSHGRSVASEYWSRAYLVLDSLRFHRSDGAIVRVVTPIENEARADATATSFVRAMAPALLRTIPR